MRLIDMRHSDYVNNYSEYVRRRILWEGGTDFINQYLVKFTDKETDTDFNNRLAISYNPSCAEPLIKGSLANLILNLGEATRIGEKKYLNCCSGLNGGVDNAGSTMLSFIIEKVLMEACFLGKVGIYVDNYIKESEVRTLEDNHPYIYIYQAEDILSWRYNYTLRSFDTLLLRASESEINADGLPSQNIIYTYRYYALTPEGVSVSFYDSNGILVSESFLDLNIIPFYMVDLGKSLLNNLDGYQIALMNIASSDLNYILKANFPFYTEQYNPKAELTTIKKIDEDGNVIADKKIEVGPTKGRRYPFGLERPGFINPSSEPILASMEKQKAMRQEMLDIVTYNLSNLPGTNEFNVESGLSLIGNKLEAAEKFICDLWHIYTQSSAQHDVIYPKSYDLKNSEDIREECNSLITLSTKVPSITFKRAIYKTVSNMLLTNKLPVSSLARIENEIDQSTVFEANAEIIQKDHESGFVSTEFASSLRGYPSGQVEQAKKDHAERLARISIAQTDPVRGVADTIDTPGIQARSEKLISRQVDEDESTKSKQRGKGKKIGND